MFRFLNAGKIVLNVLNGCDKKIWQGKNNTSMRSVSGNDRIGNDTSRASVLHRKTFGG